MFNYCNGLSDICERITALEGELTFIDTYYKIAFAKLYDRKNAITAADMLNEKVAPFFDEQQIALLRVLTGKGTEYCGKAEYHEYELYLAIENVEHSQTKVKPPEQGHLRAFPPHRPRRIL